ncbi:lipid-A-disaccharide kinase [Nitrosomonas eutropha]|uniref:Tetraacyldisaccharide 4'-kinase n=3 Tax=Nitrosomonadaceae TaxID=206379 RepID=LPXK_NITEC|nr:RecName: Full=Tetraacyldisaccharide 4'-kinase; AltName: Full=Lipid A 4'-kinase [Nitrosomonas eutropha C91]MXS80468.1 tetraacyldisaccharide 4'-kinase [Nitrosomonas sp. GH22]PXV83736.1 lipid-A-disaccharide kinase [Nitrosomonas eutropha]ABI60332.1 lipid-A-disaccharide kinase [Nitrosomonas eutropha C91]SDW52833.1 lipid-A-disaccharide kinase [Nitrosomonas eutropha]SEI53902.1 lipid-A-disaccharide kinase [Nitrosomonas eutropha]
MNWSELYWQRITPLHLLLWPVSLLFVLFQSIRRHLYRRAILTSVHLPVPVIVVDSITATSPVKTPLIIQIVNMLRASGLRPGIIGHGYTDNYHSPMSVTIDSPLQLAGKKSLLLAYYLRETCPVWIGHDRIEVAKALLETHKECNVLICNDGLQDLRLQRDFEVVIVDTSVINSGNGLIMPAGPLRDSFARLKHSNVVVQAGHHRQIPDIGEEIRTFYITPLKEHFFNLSRPELTASAAELANKRIHAVTCDPDIQNFLDNLKFLRLTVTPYIFSEDHHFVAEDFPFDEAEIILIPEEDAVKCFNLHDERIWVLQQEYRVDLGLRTIILKKLREKFMDPKLLDILACPLCKGPLIYKKDRLELICKADRLAYPIRDGIPVMLEDEARRLPDEEEIK